MIAPTKTRSFARRAPFGLRGLLAVVLAGVLAGLGCDSGSRAKDASPSTSLRSSQVSVRVDLPSGSKPSVSALAFHAEAIDTAAADVLGAVDPLAAPAPESSCELRDVAQGARRVRDQGGSLNLEELGGVIIVIDPASSLKLEPRVYQSYADVVSGVIAEAGPLDVEILPSSMLLSLPAEAGRRVMVSMNVPVAPGVFDEAEKPLETGTRADAKGDLVLRWAGPSRTFLEMRPFGAPVAIACSPGASGWGVVPHDLLVRLMANAGRAPVSFEAVWRESRLVQAGSVPTRISFEARSSAVLELRP